MKKIIGSLLLVSVAFVLLSARTAEPPATYSLKVKVFHLRNAKGTLQFTLYNKDGTIPDEKFKKYYRQQTAEINNHSSYVTFKNLPKGKYAVSILHDENENGKIDKGWIMPVEGIGFSNFSSIGFTNRPNFKKASFYLGSNTTKSVKIIYM
ncbi:MAG: hypothetical protein ACI865_001814 [Flavobacteriaceae bacterium]|jgi:uncharacterized protein (DUF2141 family)